MVTIMRIFCTVMAVVGALTLWVSRNDSDIGWIRSLIGFGLAAMVIGMAWNGFH